MLSNFPNFIIPSFPIARYGSKNVNLCAAYTAKSQRKESFKFC